MVSWDRHDINLLTLYHLSHLYFILIVWALTVHLALTRRTTMLRHHHHKTSYPCGNEAYLNLDQACLQLSMSMSSSQQDGDPAIDFFAQSTECVAVSYTHLTLPTIYSV